MDCVTVCVILKEMVDGNCPILNSFVESVQNDPATFIRILQAGADQFIKDNVKRTVSPEHVKNLKWLDTLRKRIQSDQAAIGRINSVYGAWQEDELTKTLGKEVLRTTVNWILSYAKAAETGATFGSAICPGPGSVLGAMGVALLRNRLMNKLYDVPWKRVGDWLAAVDWRSFIEALMWDTELELLY